MKWEDMRRSRNVEDRRGERPSMRGAGRGMYPGRRGGGGLGNLILMLLMSRGRGKWILILLLALFFIGGGSGLFNGGLTQNPSNSEITQQETHQGQVSKDQATDKEADFLSAVLGSTEDYWTKQFQANNLNYTPPKLVIYSEGTMTGGCGFGESTAGPFYCPADQSVYIDLSFMRELANKYGAPGDFAMAYVLAHEVGHHVQQLLGTMDQFQATVRRKPSIQNQLTVRLELQADYYAGGWARFAEEQGVLEQGDLEEALQAAHSVGDDTLQKENYGYVVPDSFTHGTSKQRQEWFARGYQYKGSFEQADTFSATID